MAAPDAVHELPSPTVMRPRHHLEVPDDRIRNDFRCEEFGATTNARACDAADASSL
jgi:hypothetical protein